jgi:hypothetical protein
MSYESQRLFNGGGSRPGEALSDYCPTGLHVLDCNTHSTSTDIYGAIDGAELLVQGKLMQLEVQYQRTETREDGRPSAGPWHKLETKTGSVAGVIYFDVSNECTAYHRVWCLPVCSDPAYSVVLNPYEKHSTGSPDQGVPTVMGLALQDIGQMSNVFRRVGMFRWTERLLFDGVPVSNLILI